MLFEVQLNLPPFFIGNYLASNNPVLATWPLSRKGDTFSQTVAQRSTLKSLLEKMAPRILALTARA